MLISSPFILAEKSTRHLMWQVILALTPGILFLVYWQGTRWLWQIGVAILAAIVIEAFILLIRRKPRWRYTITDGSAVLTALLLSLSVPVILSPWLMIFGVAFALVFGKHLYGGLGMNLFNPAMLGYVFLLVSFPVALSLYANYPVGLTSIVNGIDGYSGATILDHARTLRIEERVLPDGMTVDWQKVLLNILWLMGGLYLAYRRYLDLRIVLSVLIGVSVTAAIFWFIDSNVYHGSYVHLMAGASIFGACFIATDPVSAATTPLGRWLYGLLIGILTVCIRNWGNFPDGFAFAVLLANALVVMIDPLTQPRYR